MKKWDATWAKFLEAVGVDIDLEWLVIVTKCALLNGAFSMKDFEIFALHLKFGSESRPAKFRVKFGRIATFPASSK